MFSNNLHRHPERVQTRCEGQSDGKEGDQPAVPPPNGVLSGQSLLRGLQEGQEAPRHRQEEEGRSSQEIFWHKKCESKSNHAKILDPLVYLSHPKLKDEDWIFSGSKWSGRHCHWRRGVRTFYSRHSIQSWWQIHQNRDLRPINILNPMENRSKPSQICPPTYREEGARPWAE